MKITEIIQCLPGLGKSHFSEQRKDVIDSDDLMVEIFGNKGKSVYDLILGNSEAREKFLDAIEQAEGKILLTNFDPEDLGLPCSLRIGASPNDYPTMVRANGRLDLLKQFGSEMLSSWASDYSTKKNVVMLKPGQFVSDVLSEFFIY